MADLQPAATPQILPFGVALPEQSTTSGNSASTPQPFGATPDNPLGVEAAPRAAEAAAGQAVVRATQAQGDTAVDQAATQAAGAGNTATVQKQNLKEMEDQAAEQRLIEGEARARKLDLQKRVSGFKFEDYWQKAGTGRRVLAEIASGLLGFGTGQYHNVVQELADNEHAKQLDQITQLQKRLEQAGADEREVHQFGMEARANLSAVHAQRLNAIAAETTAQAARYNTPAARAAADLATANAKAAAAKADLEADTGLRGSVAHQLSTTKNQNAKAATSTEPAEKGAEAQILGTASDAISHGFVGMNRRQVAAAEKAAREVLAKTKTTGEGGEQQVQELLGTGSPIEGLTSPGERQYARALVHAATVLANKNKLPPAQALETLMPRSDAAADANARALKNLHDVVDSMTPPKPVLLRNGQRGVLVNGKVIVQ